MYSQQRCFIRWKEKLPLSLFLAKNNTWCIWIPNNIVMKEPQQQNNRKKHLQTYFVAPRQWLTNRRKKNRLFTKNTNKLNRKRETKCQPYDHFPKESMQRWAWSGSNLGCSSYTNQYFSWHQRYLYKAALIGVIQTWANAEPHQLSHESFQFPRHKQQSSPSSCSPQLTRKNSALQPSSPDI